MNSATLNAALVDNALRMSGAYFQKQNEVRVANK